MLSFRPNKQYSSHIVLSDFAEFDQREGAWILKIWIVEHVATNNPSGKDRRTDLPD
jgi:hypothetical protein